MCSFSYHLRIAPLLIAAATPSVNAQSCPTSDTWPAGGGDGIRYGRAVDIEGSFLAVGDYSANSYTGSVSMREWNRNVWGDPQVLTGTATGEGFGSLLDLSDNWIAITAPDYNTGAIDIYHHDGENWNYEDSYETPGEYTLIHSSMSYPWIAVAELHESGALMRVQMLQYDAVNNTWPVGDTLIMPANSDDQAFVSIDDNFLAVGLPGADIGANVNCGAVWKYERVGGVWTSLGFSTMSEPDGNYGQYVSLDAATQTLALVQHGDYVSTFEDSTLFIHRYDGGVLVSEPISEFGTMPWATNGSQINDISIDGDDLVVVLWSRHPVDEWTTHHLHRTSGIWYYQSNITPADELTYRSKYVAAMDNGMIVMDGGTLDTDRVVWVIPAEDCDESGRADACEVVLPGADGNVDGVLDRCMCAGDLDFDSDRDGDDIITFLGLWAGGTAAGDLDADGTVNVLDLLVVLKQWGECP